MLYLGFLAFQPLSPLRRCVATHRDGHRVQACTSMDRFLTMVLVNRHRSLVSPDVVCDQTGVMTIISSSQHYPATLRRVVVMDNTGKRTTFLTNNFALKPEFIADLCRQRWQIELFSNESSSTYGSRHLMAPTRTRLRRKSGSRSAHTC
jgi:hypothetical protein